VLLREQHCEVAVAGLDQQRKEIALLEVEVMGDIELEVADERRREPRELGIARLARAPERALEAAEEIERSAMLGIERVTGLRWNSKGTSYNGIAVPNYRIMVPRSIDPHQAPRTPPVLAASQRGCPRTGRCARTNPWLKPARVTSVNLA
jgi:hypothetical protein